MTDPRTPERSIDKDAAARAGDAGGLHARRVALDILRGVLARRRPLDETLETEPGLDALAPRDRAFARLLTATTLRRLGQIDTLIAEAVERALPRHAVAVKDVLRLGLAQLLFLGTPPHAAVDTSVELVRSIGLAGFKGLVNAVLRRLSDSGPGQIDRQDAGRLNTPDWLWTRWVEIYGIERTRAIAEAHLAEPPLDVTVKDPDSVPAWAGRLDGVRLRTGSVRRRGAGLVAELPGFAEGAWWVQDAAAALPARLFGDVMGQRILDLCAAPGGKTAQLAAAGARVTAVDRSARRLGRVRDNLARLGLAAELAVEDAAGFAGDPPYDGVLLDAPCSATGTIRRHPDILYLKRADDIARLAELQARLLAHAVELVRPGGLLVWCTCSLEPEEGERQIDRLLASSAPMERVPIDAAEIGGLDELVTGRGEIRSLPCHLGGEGGIDGFHIARLRRRAES